jgi:hypothetical protein
MIRGILCGAFALVAGAAVVAQADPKADLTAAIDKLGSAANYSWTTTTASSGGFTPGPQEGKTEKGAITSFSTSFQDNTTVIYIKGTKAVVKGDSGYQTTEEIQAAAQGGGGFNPSMFAVFMASTLKLPAEQTKEWSDKLQNIALADGVYTADLDEESAKALMSFGRGRRGGAAPAGADAPPAPTVKDAKCSVKFWVTDGSLTKYEMHMTGTRTFNDQDNPVDTTRTTEIKEVGTTKVDVPDDAKAKLNG